MVIPGAWMMQHHLYTRGIHVNFVDSYQGNLITPAKDAGSAAGFAFSAPVKQVLVRYKRTGITARFNVTVQD